jgi:cold shock CspA family protein
MTLSTVNETLTGQVKWFNNKSGYGFISVQQGEASDSDIFVHHSAILTGSDRYKYLVQGEYVSFSLSAASEESNHKFQATGVTGMFGGKLMCETRDNSHSEGQHPKTKVRSNRTNDQPPSVFREGEWSLVRTKSTK